MHKYTHTQMVVFYIGTHSNFDAYIGKFALLECCSSGCCFTWLSCKWMWLCWGVTLMDVALLGCHTSGRGFSGVSH